MPKLVSHNDYFVNTPSSLALFDRLWILLLVCAYIGFIYMLAYGIDITDEGFYLELVSHPSNDIYITTQFGFLLRPLWIITGENIHLYRAIFWTLQITLTFTIFQGLISENLAFNAIRKNLLAASFSILVLGYLYDWIPTPSYNSLALLTVQLFSIAFIRTPSWTMMRGIVIGLAGALAFLTKPTIAILFLIITTIAAIFSIKVNCKKISISLSIAGLVALAIITAYSFLSHGSLIQFYQNLNEGVRIGNILYGGNWITWGNILWKTDNHSLTFGSGELRLIILNGFLFFISPFVYTEKYYGTLIQSWTSRFLIGVTGISILFLFFVIADSLPLFTQLDRFALNWVPPLCMLLGISVAGLISKELRLRDFGLSALLLLMPYSFTVGTSLSYVSAITILYVFAYASCIPLIKNTKLLLPLICLLIYGLCTLASSMPFSGRELYRQPALWGADRAESSERFTSGPLRGLIVSKAAADYFTQLSDLAYQNGFNRGGGIIDLTGASPGAIFAIDAKSIGAGWLIGGYPGSSEVARFKLGKAHKHEIDNSWVLHEEWESDEWKRKLPVAVLGVAGLNLEQDYVAVGSVMIPKGFGGRKGSNQQTLYRPKVQSQPDSE